MINIFSDNKSKRNSRKLHRKNSSTKKVENTDAIKAEKLSKINPMAIPLFVVKRDENPRNEWISSTLDVLINNPHRLSEKWINSINSWTEELIKAISLDPPDDEEGARKEFGPLIVYKIANPNENSAYPMPAIISVDKRGWKWYFKTSKAYKFTVGDKITFTATISAHKEGITFLRRPSKINKVVAIQVFEDSND